MFLVLLKRNLLLFQFFTHLLFTILVGQSGYFKWLSRIVRHLFPSFLEFLELSVPQLFKFSTYNVFFLVNSYISEKIVTPQTPFASSTSLDHTHNPNAFVPNVCAISLSRSLRLTRQDRQDQCPRSLEHGLKDLDSQIVSPFITDLSQNKSISPLNIRSFFGTRLQCCIVFPQARGAVHTWTQKWANWRHKMSVTNYKVS